MADVKIRLMSPEDLIPYEKNPRNNDEAVEAVMQSIQDFGFKNPVIVDKNNVIIAGHTRIKAAIRLGLEKVPVIRADDLTEEQAKAYRLVDNKTGELATWDLELLDLELTSTSWDMTPYGFEITDTFYDLDPSELVDIEPEEVPEEPETKAGDMYKLGNHVLLCGDSTKEYDVLKKEFLSTRAYFDNSQDTMTNVWTFGRTSGKEREETGSHATPKPIELCARAIKSSSQVGDVIYDFFGGSGSTLVTAEQLGRKCAMMELDPGYCDVIIRRWEKLTGLQAEKINDK